MQEERLGRLSFGQRNEGHESSVHENNEHYTSRKIARGSSEIEIFESEPRKNRLWDEYSLANGFLPYLYF